MSTLKATNIKNVSSGTNNIVLGENGGVVISGLATVSNANVTGGTITGVSTIGVTTLTVSNANITGGTITGVSTVSSTAFSVNGNAYPSAGPLSNRNLIINGAMQVAQRGTSSTTASYGSVDRFFAQAQNGAITHSQTAITSGTPYDEGFRNVLRMTNTTANTAADAIRNPFQYIEAQNLANSGWNYTSSSSYVTLSFWVRSSVAQEFYGYLRTFDGTEQRYCFSLGSLSANTWTKVTKVIPGNSNITIDNDNGTGLQVNISPFWGTNFTDSGVSVDTWGAYASGTRTPDYTNTWAGTTDATFDITGVQLEVGSVATPFEHQSYGDELRRCQRYYVDVLAGKSSNNTTICIGAQYNSSTAFGTIHLPVQMRTGPAIEVSNSSAYYRLYVNNSDVSVSTFLLDGASNARAVDIEASASATAGHASLFRTKNSAAILRLTAEL